MRKLYFIIILVVLALLALVFGVWARTLHTEFARSALTVALVFEVIITLIFIWVLLMWFKKTG